MSCERYREALTELAAGGPATAGLRAHIDGCAGCQRELAALGEALGLADASLAELASAEPSPEFGARLRQRATGEPLSEGVGPWSWAWLATAAVVCVAVAVAVMWRGTGGERSATVAQAPAPVSATAPLASLPPTSAEASAPPAGPSSAPASAPTVDRFAARRVADRRAEPEVLVSEGGQRALLQYVALVHQQKADPSALLAVGQPSPDLPEREIQLKPVEIAPLDPAEAQGT
jgi:hypothetical protein